MSVRFALIGAAAGALLLAGLLAERHWYGARQYKAGIARANTDHAMAELAEFKAHTARLSGISTTLEGALTALRDASPKVIERYTRVEVQSPLPAGCRLDPERLQHINEAGRLANSAGQPGPAVPASGGGDER
ncbi:hypothetical protein [Bordetella trematum]|uniref:hypothetical protein n=1 Tax=Bordetella trematum TaxID=123899 RepID=UPI00046FAC2B|nr:hypothetical protein [Bordetella trematum]